MPLAPTYPGVYVQETPSGVRTISGVATAVAAFVDRFDRGPVDRAVRVSSWGQVERYFGGLSESSQASFALDQFFRNGGGVAWVVRVAPAAATANVIALAGVGGAAALTLQAASPGGWGNFLRATVFARTATSYDLAVRQVRIADGREQVVQEILYANLSTATADVRFADSVVNPPAGDIDSLAAAVVRVAAVDTRLPMSSGVSGVAPAATAFTTDLNAAADKRVTVELFVGGVGVETRELNLGAPAIVSLSDAAGRIQGALRASLPGVGGVAGRAEFAQARALVTPAGTLQILPGTGATADVRFLFTNMGGGAATVATVLGIIGAAVSNVAAYQVGSPVTSRAQGAGAAGTNGNPVDAAAIIGSSVVPRTGINALDDATDLNLLCLPRISEAVVSATAIAAGDAAFPEAQVDPALSAAIAYCEQRRAMLLVDPPAGVATVSGISTWVNAHAGLRHRNVVIHFPRLIIGDPLNDFRDRSIGNSGAIAGICARIDASRGVWKAPAGIEAVIRGPRRLETRLTDDENGVLNPIAINCLRTFDLYGTVNWGSRTSVGEDVRGSEWRYVPVRRTALFIEETLFRSTKWVIHEGNDEPLWAQVRLSVGAFMNDLFRQGAFAGRTKAEAYFVRCDATTTTPIDQLRGVVNLVVGFAPLRPAEFLVISIQQIPSAVEV